jgi:hypothetical protein
MQLSPCSCRTRCNSKAANTEDACTSAPPWWNLRAGNGHGHGDQVPARGSHPGERARTSDVPSRLANSVTRAARASRAGSGPGSACALLRPGLPAVVITSRRTGQARPSRPPGPAWAAALSVPPWRTGRALPVLFPERADEVTKRAHGDTQLACHILRHSPAFGTPSPWLMTASDPIPPAGCRNR